MPFFIKPPVTMAFKLCSFSGWNCWFSSVGIDIVNKLIAVISFVGQYLTPFYVYLAQHWKGEGNIVFLPFADHQVNRITVRIDYGMDFLCWLRLGCVRFCLEAPFLRQRCADVPRQWNHPKKVHHVQPQGSKYERYYQGRHRRSICRDGCKQFLKSHIVPEDSAKVLPYGQSRQYHSGLHDYFFVDGLVYPYFGEGVSQQCGFIHQLLARIVST